jgi:type IV secretion system protein VirD4
MPSQKGIRIGHAESGDVMRYRGPGHLITIAPTRVGKWRDAIIPALLEQPGSCVVVDPKGDVISAKHKQLRTAGLI